MKTVLIQKTIKSFCKCIKSVNNSSQILSIQTDINIHPITTTNQVNNIEPVGIVNYFKPYKRTNKTLSGDFHIGTKLSFEDLKNNKTVQTWFHNHGYWIILNGCQSADMVQVGFLSRVRTFSYRDDLLIYIMNTREWKEKQFHFRLYFDSFSAGIKGKSTHVLMIDVNCPSVDIALHFFQTYFNGEHPNSPNNIHHLFLPLYKKSHTEEEHQKIIDNNDHHTDKVSVVVIQGLNDLESVITLTNGVHTTIHRLLLSIPSVGISTGKLFLQIEHQAVHKWLLCCFYSIDSTKVTLRLSQLTDLLIKYVHTDSLDKLFKEDYNLKFSGQVAPIRKGRTWFPRYVASEETENYTRASMERMYTPVPKRLASEMDTTMDLPSWVISPSIVQHSPTSSPIGSNWTPAPTTQADEMTTLKQTMESHGKTLATLEACCQNLATTTSSLRDHFKHMNIILN